MFEIRLDMSQSTLKPPTPPAFTTLVDLLRFRAEQQPEQHIYIFLLDGEVEYCRWTCANLEQHARTIAVLLQNERAEGERVLLLYPPGPDYVAAFFGCLYAGAIAVPAYPPRSSRHASRVQGILQDSEAAIALTTSELLPQIQSSLNATNCSSACTCLTTDDLSKSTSAWLPPNISPDDLAFLQYTSGSTGDPKGVMVSHGNVLHNLSQIQSSFAHNSHSRGVIWLPPYHDMGLIGGILQPLFLGCPVVLMPPTIFLQKPIRWLQAISKYRATTSGGPNFAYDFCVSRISTEQKATLDLSCWDVAFNGAEPIRAETLQRFSEAFADCGFRSEAFYPCYGMAETTLIVSGGPPNRQPILKHVQASTLEQNQVVPCEHTEGGRTLVSCGQTISEQNIRIVEPHSQLQCPAGQVGEIWVAGQNVTRGYWNNPSETQATFSAFLADTHQGPYLRTGDLGFLDLEDELFVTGRLKDLIIIRGRNFYPHDIERVAEKSHPALRINSGAAFAVAIDNQERLIIAHEVERSYLRKLNVAEIASAMRGAVSEEFDLEVHTVLLLKTNSLLKTSSGKIQRQGCRSAFLNGTLNILGQDELSHISAYVAPQTERQSLLVQLFAEVLSLPIEHIGIHDNFFELGGQSLLATQFVARVREALTVDLSLRMLFESPTVAALDALLANGLASHPSDPGSSIPLSSAQERLWFLAQLEEHSATYNIPAAIRIDGNVDIHALQQSIDELARRHQILRTTFPTVDGTAIQHIEPTLDIPVQVVAASDLKINLSAWLTQESQHPFDLETGPLLRVNLLLLSEDMSALSITMHHIISDGWSMGVLIHELAILYNAYLQGQASPLPPLPIQYTDYTLWQHQWLQGEILDTQLHYWKLQLADAPALLQLPSDHPRPAVQTFRGRTYQTTLPLALKEQAKTTAQHHGVTLFMLLLAAFQVLLYRYSGQQDIVVGSPIANRQRAELESLIGFFANTLVLRAQIDDNDSVTTLLQKVKRLALEAYEHQDVPFEQVVDALQPERSLSYTPLFQVMFVLQNAPMAPPQLSGLTLTPLVPETVTSKFDLTLSMEETNQGLMGRWEYNSDLFEAATIERMSAHFETLLQAMVADSTQSVSMLPMLSAAERRQLLVEWTDTAVAYPQGQTIHELFEAQVERTPVAVAVVFEEQQLTYQQLNAQSNQVAHYLRGVGVGPEVLVGLCVERSLEMVVGLLGILKAGGAYVPLDPNYPQERLGFMLEDAKCLVLLTQERLLARLPAHGAKVVCLDRDAPLLAEALPTNPQSEATADNLAYVIYTSGSTGTPKGVLLQHDGLCNLALAQQDLFNVSTDSQVLQFASLSFDASTWEIFMALAAGATLILATPTALMPGEQLQQTLQTYAVSHITLPPSALAVLTTEQLPALQHIITAGEACPLDLAQRWSTLCPFWNAYGPTEVTVCATATQVDHKVNRLSIGRPIANMQVYVLDPHLQPVPIGVPGELHIGGVGLARGYLNRPDLSAEKFVVNPFDDGRLYKTGDLACYLPDGSIEFLGRLDHQVKIRGFRIELGEIESVLASHEQVQHCVVITLGNTLSTKRLVACVVGDDQLNLTVLTDHLRRQLPDYMVPSVIIPLASLPLTPNGKVDRKVLPDLLGELSCTREFVLPQTERQTLIATLWAKVLSLPTERIGIHDNFFELGGQSLLATQLVAHLQKTFEVELSLRTLFQAPTVAELDVVLAHSVAVSDVAIPAIAPAERNGDPIPLSYAQERLWFLAQLEGEVATYNIPAAVQIDGVLDVKALQHAIDELVRRHESLRTTFPTIDGTAVQQIEPTLHIPLKILEPTAIEGPLSNWLSQESLHPFDLESGPLLRVSLIQLSEATSALSVMMHHIISDGWSMGVLIRELATLYNAHLQGQSPPLSPLPIQYTDYTLWQRQWLQGDIFNTQLSYWQQQLADAPALLQLPTDYPRPAVQTFRGQTYTMDLPLALSHQVKRFAQTQEVTMFMTLLAAFQVLLYRYSGQPDIVIGSPIANRQRAELESLIGFFVNTLVLRVQIEDTDTIATLLHKVRTMALEAYTHQDIPFEQVVEALQPERSLAHSPLFQVMFALQNAPMEPLELSGVTLTPLTTGTISAKFDLTLSMEETDQGLVGRWEYNSDLFAANTIERMATHFEQLLSAMVVDESQTITTLPLLSEAEQQKLLVEWNDTTVEYPHNLLFHQLVEVQVERTPDAIAVVFENQQLTYQDLNAKANQVAHRLQALGVEPDGRVGICMERSVEMVVGLLGILKAGGAYVPLDSSYPQDRLAFMLQDAQCPVLLTQQQLVERLPDHHAQVICLDTDEPILAREQLVNPISSVSENNLAYVIYTSGTTGQPKGVLSLHKSIRNRLLWMQDVYQLNSSDRILQKTPFSFDVSVWEFFWPLMTGACLVMARPDGHKDSTYLAQVIAQQAITVIHFVPSMLHAFLMERNLQSCHSLRHVICSGEALTLNLQERFFEQFNDTRLHNLYGPTEAAVDVTFWECEHQAERASVPIGRPIANTQIFLLDQHLQPVPIGVAGELHIGGVGLARGYLNRPDLTTEKFISHPFSDDPEAKLYKTGDLARYRPDSAIEYLGRTDHQVKLRGFRIEIGAIETVLRQCPTVQEAVVTVYGNESEEQRLIAYIVAEQGEQTEVKTQELRHFLSQKLPAYMIPSSFISLEALPLTPNGKLDRKALPAPVLHRDELDNEFIAPRNLSEQQIAEIWCQVLQIDRVGVQDNFFELGGHSLLATQLVSRMSSIFQIEVPLRTLFEEPTIAGLSTKVEHLKHTNVSQELPSIEPVSCDQVLPLSFAQERLWFLAFLEGPGSTYNIPVALQLSGILNIPTLKQAIAEIKQRHEVLRTSFSVVENRPLQVISADAEMTLSLVDLSKLGEDHKAIEQQRLIYEEAWRPFDLANDVLLRGSLIKLSEEEHVLVLTIHHIVFDGWSIGIFVQELSSLYQTLEGNASTQLPPLPIQYADYSCWQREWLHDKVLDKQLEYWRHQISGAPPLLELPTDYPRPPVQTFQGAEVSFEIATDDTQALKKLSQQTGTTLFMTLLATFAVLLSRYSSQKDMVIGSPIANRHHPETERLIGFFVNTLALRINLEGDPSFHELLGAHP